MGVKGLAGFVYRRTHGRPLRVCRGQVIEENACEVDRDKGVKGFVVDGNGLVHFIAKQIRCDSTVDSIPLGLDFFVFGKDVFLEKLQERVVVFIRSILLAMKDDEKKSDNNSRIIVVFDGLHEDIKAFTRIQRMKSSVKAIKAIARQIKGKAFTKEDFVQLVQGTRDIPLSPFAISMSIRILHKYFNSKEVEVLVADGEGDEICATICNENHFFGIIGDDSDFFIFRNVSYIPFESISFSDFNRVSDDSQSLCMQLRCFDSTLLKQLFQVDLRFLPMIASIIGNDWTGEIQTELDSLHIQFLKASRKKTKTFSNNIIECLFRYLEANKINSWSQDVEEQTIKMVLRRFGPNETSSRNRVLKVLRSSIQKYNHHPDILELRSVNSAIMRTGDGADFNLDISFLLERFRNGSCVSLEIIRCFLTQTYYCPVLFSNVENFFIENSKKRLYGCMFEKSRCIKVTEVRATTWESRNKHTELVEVDFTGMHFEILGLNGRNLIKFLCSEECGIRVRINTFLYILFGPSYLFQESNPFQLNIFLHTAVVDMFKLAISRSEIKKEQSEIEMFISRINTELKKDPKQLKAILPSDQVRQSYLEIVSVYLTCVNITLAAFEMCGLARDFQKSPLDLLILME